MFTFLHKNRSCVTEVYLKKGVLRNFTNFTGKHLCQSLFLIKLQAKTCNFVKNETSAQVFSCGFCEISRTPFPTEDLWWLLLQENIWFKVVLMILMILITFSTKRRCVDNILCFQNTEELEKFKI